MRYAIFGPFDFDEALAVTTCSPLEVPFWRTRTYLEDAAIDALHLAGKNAHCRSSHFAGNSTVTYGSGARMILGQIDEPLKGFFACSEKTASAFSNGLNILIDEKLNPESSINKRMDEERERIGYEIKNNPLAPKDVIDKIQKSRILDAPDRSVLNDARSKTKPAYKNKKDFTEFVENFYPQELFGRCTYIGNIFHYFSLPVIHLIEPAKRERLELGKKFGDDINFLTKCFNSAEALFGKD